MKCSFCGFEREFCYYVRPFAGVGVLFSEFSVFIIETLMLFVMVYLFAMTTCYGLVVYFGLIQGVSVVGCLELVLFIALCSILFSFATIIFATIVAVNSGLGV